MSQGDWDALNEEQRRAINAWRLRISKVLTEETKKFYQEHPEIRLTWCFTSEPLLCVKHPVIYEEC